MKRLIHKWNPKRLQKELDMWVQFCGENAQAANNANQEIVILRKQVRHLETEVTRLERLTSG